MIKIYNIIDKYVVRTSWSVLRFQPLLFFLISLLPRHFEKQYCTVFNSQACAESKNYEVSILGLKLVIFRKLIKKSLNENITSFGLF